MCMKRLCCCKNCNVPCLLFTLCFFNRVNFTICLDVVCVCVCLLAAHAAIHAMKCAADLLMSLTTENCMKCTLHTSNVGLVYKVCIPSFNFSWLVCKNCLIAFNCCISLLHFNFIFFIDFILFIYFILFY